MLKCISLKVFLIFFQVMTDVEDDFVSVQEQLSSSSEFGGDDHDYIFNGKDPENDTVFETLGGNDDSRMSREYGSHCNIYMYLKCH